jgi:TatD DNase family protein
MNAAPTPLVDTHCHLNMAVFEKDFESVLARAREAGITKIVIPGTDLETSKRAIDLAGQHPGLYAAVGVHPHDAKTWQESSSSELRELANHPEVVAIGEIGLDYYRNYSDPDIQRKVFWEQLNLAGDLGFPVIVHNRDAIDDVVSMLVEWTSNIPEPLRGHTGVLHAFSSHPNSASKAIEMGFYIGIAGPITFRKAGALRDLVATLPMERILTETDAPYLTPEPHRGKRNEPGYVQFVANAIANTRQLEIDQAKEQTAVNASVLFRWNHEISDSHVL